MRSVRRTLGLIGAALLIVGCSSGDDDAADVTTSSTTTAVAESSTTTTEPVEALQADALTAGDQHACAISSGDTVCWGYNYYGQLGDGTTDDHQSPEPIAGDVSLAVLAAGRYFTCGLTVEGEAWCWGENDRGQLGDGSTEPRLEPVPVQTDVRFATIVAGQAHVCGIAIGDSATWCWGAYASGQLAGAGGADQLVPALAAPELSLDRLAIGGHVHTCGLTSEGAAYCWGNNTFGQLGDGEKTNAAQGTPRPVVGDLALTEVVLGFQHTCGLTVDGAAWCWGANGSGQLGTGAGAEHLEPTAVSGEHAFVQLTAGGTHTCGIDGEGAAWCWGDNPDGRVGNGQEGDDVPEPVAVSGDLAFELLRGGEEFTCGILTDGTVVCWGSNRGGWLGDGTLEAHSAPAPILPSA